MATTRTRAAKKEGPAKPRSRRGEAHPASPETSHEDDTTTMSGVSTVPRPSRQTGPAVVPSDLLGQARLYAPPEGWQAVFYTDQGELVYEPIAMILFSGDTLVKPAALVGGIGGFALADAAPGFLGVCGPDPDDGFWQEAAEEALKGSQGHEQES